MQRGIISHLQAGGLPCVLEGRRATYTTPTRSHGRSQRPVICAAKRSTRQRAPAPSPPSIPPSSSQSQVVEDDDDVLVSQYTREKVEIMSINIPLSSLLNNVNDGSLNLEPEYQRDFVWDAKKCVGLIKTVYEGLPVPAVMLFKRRVQDFGIVHEVVDGKQRLAAIWTFMKGDNSKFPKAPTVIKLDPKEDELGSVLNGKAFKDLSREEQSNMQNYMMQVQCIPESTPLRMVFRIYENINAGGMEHSEQQLRRAAFHGAYIKLLSRLALPSDPAGQKLCELAALTEDELRAQQAEELVLRFFALRRAAIPSNKRPFRAPMKNFLNEEVQTVGPSGRKVVWEPTPAEQAVMEDVFRTTVELAAQLRLKEVYEGSVRDAGGKGKSFRRGGGSTGAGPLWDTTLVGLSLALDRCDKLGVYERNAAALQAGYRRLLASPEWAAIPSTLSHKSLMRRLELFQEVVVAQALGGDPKASPQPRAFSQADKAALLARSPNPVCAWCGNPIVDASRTEVDHVLPYSHGGATTLDNGQLLHWYCNRERGTKPMSEGPAAARAAAAAAAAAAVISRPGPDGESGGGGGDGLRGG